MHVTSISLALCNLKGPGPGAQPQSTSMANTLDGPNRLYFGQCTLVTKCTSVGGTRGPTSKYISPSVTLTLKAHRIRACAMMRALGLRAHQEVFYIDSFYAWPFVTLSIDGSYHRPCVILGLKAHEWFISLACVTVEAQGTGPNPKSTSMVYSFGPV